jgi:preprotein translocase subunit SecB
MSTEFKSPAFIFLGYNIQQVNFKRVGNEVIKEIRLSISSAKYDEDRNIYSLVLTVQIDFSESKNSFIEVLGGFKIYDEKIIGNRDFINSIFAASLYPYLRTILHNITTDDRGPIMLPTIDLRNLNMKNGISIKPNKQQEEV